VRKLSFRGQLVRRSKKNGVVVEKYENYSFLKLGPQLAFDANGVTNMGRPADVCKCFHRSMGGVGNTSVVGLK